MTPDGGGLKLSKSNSRTTRYQRNRLLSTLVLGTRHYLCASSVSGYSLRSNQTHSLTPLEVPCPRFPDILALTAPRVHPYYN